MGLNAGDKDFVKGFRENLHTGETNRVLTFYISIDSTMKTLLASSTLFLTVILALAFGVACGYAAITAILRAFGHKPAVAEQAPPTAAMATSASSH